MKYPVVTRKATESIVARFLADPGATLNDGDVEWAGSGSAIELSAIEECAAAIEKARQEYLEAAAQIDQDHVEGRAAVPLHQTLSGLDLTLLDDPGFWRYLTLAHFWPLVYWREQKAFDTQPPPKYLVYVDAVRTTETVLTRMFLRANAVRDGDDYSLVTSSREATDFWRSHVLRVTVGSAPNVARPFARLHRDKRMSTNDLRAFARRLNRLSTNVALPLVSEEEAAQSLAELDSRSTA